MPTSASEGERGGLVRCQRRIEPIDTMLIKLVILLQSCAGNIDLEQFRFRIGEPDMQYFNRCAGIVDHLVSAASFQPAFLWEDIDCKGDVGQRWLLQGSVLKILFLILGQKFFVRVLITIGVLNVHLIEQERTCAYCRQDTCKAKRASGRRKTAGQLLNPWQQPCLRAATPQQVSKHRKQQRHAAIVQPQPPSDGTGNGIAVHIGNRV